MSDRRSSTLDFVREVSADERMRSRHEPDPITCRETCGSYVIRRKSRLRVCYDTHPSHRYLRHISTFAWSPSTFSRAMLLCQKRRRRRIEVSLGEHSFAVELPGNVRKWESNHKMFIRLLRNVKSQLKLTSPFFLFDPAVEMYVDDIDDLCGCYIGLENDFTFVLRLTVRRNDAKITETEPKEDAQQEMANTEQKQQSLPSSPFDAKPADTEQKTNEDAQQQTANTEQTQTQPSLPSSPFDALKQKRSSAVLIGQFSPFSEQRGRMRSCLNFMSPPSPRSSSVRSTPSDFENGGGSLGQEELEQMRSMYSDEETDDDENEARKDRKDRNGEPDTPIQPLRLSFRSRLSLDGPIGFTFDDEDDEDEADVAHHSSGFTCTFDQ